MLMTNETIWPIAVAQAAPAMPHLQANMKTGSRMIFMIAPASIENIDHDGLPSARTTALIIFDSI